MRFSFTEDQRGWAEALSDLAMRHWTSDHRELTWAGDLSAETNLATTIAEAGVMGLAVAESLGGLGQELLDLAPALEQAGYHCLPDWIAQHLIATSLLVDEPELAAQAVGGELIMALSLDGQKIPHPERVNSLLLINADGAHVHQNCQFELLETVDRARPLGRLISSKQSRILNHHESAKSVYNRSRNLLTLADALQLLGVSQAALDVSVAYVSERRQFGKPVGAQQAVKHQLANALIELEFARPMVQRACYTRDQDARETNGRVSGAWLLATHAAREVERTALQVHGAMGYSYEYPLHHLLKRSWALRYAQSPESTHRQRAQAWLMEDKTND